jgi:predicted MFS family arabinose efflux permease
VTSSGGISGHTALEGVTGGARRYASVVSIPHVGGLVASAFLAYVGFAGRSLALVLFVHARTGSFATAGGAVAATAVGGALFAPVRGRLLDRFGQTAVIVPLSLVYGAALGSVVAVGHAPAAAVFGLCVLAGATFPAVFASMRAIWSELLRGDDRLPTAYALESVVQELALVSGPLVAAATASIASASAAVALSAASTTAGALVFAGSPLSRHWHGEERESVGLAGALASPGIRAMVASMILFGASGGGIQVVVPALSSRSGTTIQAGLLLAAMAAASMLSGLWYGATARDRDAARDYRRWLAALGVALAFLPAARPAPAAAVVLAVAGVAVAPTFVSSFSLLDAVAPRGTATEAFTWMASAYVGGLAAGAALAGVVVQSAGLGWALATPASWAVASALVASASRGLLARGPNVAAAERAE